jgi:fructoselysine-6-P-deglycase FrlB-like protein
VVVAVVNDAASPLADLAEIVIPVHAGAETSVAATKSFRLHPFRPRPSGRRMER